MKKLLITGLFLVCAFAMVNAQDSILKSKKGIPILPQAGDFAIGISAAPILNFFGEAVKINSGAPFASPAAFNFTSNNAIYGKYFLDNNTAIRAQIRIGRNSTTITNKSSFSNDTSGTGAGNPKFVEDKYVSTSSSILLAVGLEKRRGYGRLQGYYGAQLLLSVMGGSSQAYTYGNGFDATHTNPDRFNFGTNVPAAGVYVTEVKTKGAFGFGLNAFVGVEYFIAPKMSIGGEVGWGLGMNQGGGVSGITTTTTEAWTGTVVKSTSIESGKRSTFNVDTYSTGGQLFLLFHF